nr:hypothetical protein [Tanacetum cinerariifolium]
MYLEDKGVIDSRCSRHTTENKSYLKDYKEIDGVYVTFGGNHKGGKITGKCTIKTGNLDFENVFFVRELKFNLFSVFKMYDKKNNVLFNDTECIILSPNFKLIDESQVLLRVPRKTNMYSVDLKSIVPKEGLTCLFAKATSDESKLWHRWLGHLNFKTMNKLVKGNLVRGTQSNGFAGTKAIDNAGQDDGFKPSSNDEKKVDENPSKRSECNDQEKQDNVNSSNNVNTISSTINDANTNEDNELLFDPNMLALEDVGIFDFSNKDEDDDEMDDMNNLDTTIQVNPTPTIRIHKDHPLDQMNVNSAFLYGKIEKEMYVCQSPGFEDPDFPNRVYKVEKALYRLHQDPRAWYETLSTYLLDNSFQRGKIDKTLFIKRHKGLQVKQKNDGIFISQDKYVAKNLKKFGFTEVKNASTPMETKKPLLKDEDGEEFAVYIYRYLKGHPKLGLWYPKDYPFNMVAYTDSDYARASLDRKSIIGGYQFLRCRLISWQCKKQTVVANSTTKAEYVDASSCCGQVLWIRNQLLDYGAFLYGKIEKEMYVCQSPGFEDPDFPNRVYKVEKALYRLHQDPRACQDKYVAKNLKKFGFTEVKNASTPMETKKPLLKDEDGEEFAVYIYRYLKGHPKLGLWYPKDYPFNMVAYTDSDYARASLDRKSTIGGYQFLRCRLISWQCKKQTVVANSTTKAEYVDASSCCGQVLWIRNQLLDYGRDLRLADEDGVDCLPNSNIFENHELMSTMASAIICLATNQEFNFSKLIFDSMIRNLDNASGKILMYPRLARAATTASSLEAEQDSGNIDKTQSKAIPTKSSSPVTTSGGGPSDSPLLRVNTPRSDEDRLKLMELMVFLLQKGFWNTACVKRSDDVTRLQALVDRKKIVISEVVIHEILQLDDAEGIVCLPNKEIFAGLAQMGYEKPSTKLTFYKAFFSRVETSLFKGMLNARQLAEEGIAEEQVQADDAVVADVQENIIKLKARVKRLEKANKVKSSKLRHLRKVGASKRIKSSDDMEDVFNQGRIIDDLDKDEGIELVVDQVKDADIAKTEGRHAAKQAKKQAEIYHLDLDHSFKDKGKGILIETLKPMKKKDQIKLDAEYARKLHEEINKDHKEINKDIDWDAAIDHNTAGYKMDFFKGMSYDEICPIFQARFDANMRFLSKSREEMEEEDQEVLKSINETPAQKAAKRWKLNEEAQEAEDLKKRLELILLVERRYPLLKFTLEQLVNVTRLQVEEESEMSLELLRFTRQQLQEYQQG